MLKVLLLLLVQIAAFVLLIGCATSYRVFDVIELPPPQQVQAERHDDQVTIRWQAGVERRHPKFSGYRLFMATRSLASTPVWKLPSPIILPDTINWFSFTSADTSTLFLHIRSCAGKQKLSLPSLPEVMVPGKSIRQAQNHVH
ncbi:MAG: hypothetical protein ONB44_10625 [candidate division KSB1 bacterium]|nr:hypothetical protein [candidate division KSB1 bacterium]MDZ7302578.1 hypothetical protein [candidate division KSB1 bacterium]MDZ7311581.1 hypothetical protein [candidate division KSB1 bacterium]